MISPQIQEAEDILLRGSGVCALAGRGMGKSAFLLMLEKSLSQNSSVRVIRIASPPPTLAVPDLLALLATRLKLAVESHSTSQFLLETFFEENPDTDMVVLLFDEFDRYAVNPSPADQHHPGRAFLNDLETARKELDGRLGILAAGSIGTFVFRDILGSTFLSRAEWIVFQTLNKEEIQKLSEPFNQDKRPLDGDLPGRFGHNQS